MDKKAFIEKIYNSISKYDSKLFNSIMIAQAILESDWGRSYKATYGNNFTGHKDGSDWSGESFVDSSFEYDKNGNRYNTTTDKWRKYKSVDEWAENHAKWIERTPYHSKIYAKVINAKTPEEQSKELQGTYATDINYANSIMNVINTYNLKQYDKKNKKQNGDGEMSKMNLVQACKALGLTLKVEILPLTKTFGANSSKKIGITVHQTGAPGVGQNARAMANYQRNMSNPNNWEQKSWHIQVDDHEAIQSFPTNVGCWASSDGRGDGNMNTIQIESCINADGNYNKGIENLAKLIAAICYVEGFNPYKQIYTHYYWSKRVGRAKWCPNQILNSVNGYTLAKVVDMSNGYLQKLKGNKSVVTEETGYNPQGLKEIPVPAYEATEIPFKKLNVGDTVTLTKNWLWFNPNNNKQMLSKRQEELTGTKDEIAEVKDIKDIGHSRYAYRLKKYNSWILEQDLEEPRADWKVVDKVENNIEKEDGKSGGVELKEGQFVLYGKVYQVTEVK